MGKDSKKIVLLWTNVEGDKNLLMADKIKNKKVFMKTNIRSKLLHTFANKMRLQNR